LAQKLCERLPRGPFENPGHAFLVGRALYETGQIDDALPLLEQAISLQADNPEAHYYLGLIFDEREDSERAIEAFLEARRLDLEVPHHGFSLSRDAFRDTARQTISELPSEIQERVAAAELYFLDVPGAEVVIDGVDPRAVLLVETTAATDPSSDAPRERLYFYQRNIERVVGSLEAVREELEAALVRELGAPESTEDETP
jgi:tetratricopeptide (TPR) repeat protein